MGRAKAEELIEVYDEKIIVLKARLEERQRLLAEALDKQEKRQKTVNETKQELADCRRKLENARAYMERQAQKASQAAEKSADRKTAAPKPRRQNRSGKKAAQDPQMDRLMQSITSSGLSVDDVMAMLQKPQE